MSLPPGIAKQHRDALKTARALRTQAFELERQIVGLTRRKKARGAA